MIPTLEVITLVYVTTCDTLNELITVEESLVTLCFGVPSVHNEVINRSEAHQLIRTS